MRVFDVPKDYNAAREAMTALEGDINEIQTQLKDKDRKGDDGDRLSSGEYKTWRQRACYALSCKINEYRFLKKWESNHLGVSKGEGRLDNRDVLIVGAYRAMRNMGFLLEWDNIDNEIQEAIDNIQFYLLTKDIIC